jgi:hypothetical protein
LARDKIRRVAARVGYETSSKQFVSLFVAIVALASVIFAAPATAASGPAPAGTRATSSAPTYTDKLNGFALRPPIGCDRIKEPGTSCLVRWVSLDANTKTIFWTLGVNVALQSDPNITMREYAKILGPSLKDQDNLESVATFATQVGGKEALDIRGVAVAGGSRVWRRQVWVLAQPGRFLIFWVSGLEARQNAMHEILQEALSTVKITDPIETLKAQDASLRNGRQFLAALGKKALAPAQGLQWYVFRQDGNIVGWTVQKESLARRGKQDGLEIQTLTMLRLPGDRLRLSRRTLFGTAGGGEQWKETLQIGEGDKKEIVQEEGTRQGNMIVCAITYGADVKTRKKEVPSGPDANEPTDMYLPHCLGMILPRLLDLSRARAYSFATYSSRDNNYRLRTFTVIGPQKIALNSRQVEAVRMSDMESANEETTTDMWVDASGMPLRIQSPGWPVIEAGTRREIEAGMPEAASAIDEAITK